MKTIMTVIGTRPEAIKLAPVIAAFSTNNYFKNEICITRQHTSLLDSLLIDLNISVNYQFEPGDCKGSLCQSAAHLLPQFSNLLESAKPDLVIVQGDTTSAFIASLAAYYLHVPIAHIEAGLRTGDIYAPWPEEIHRCFIDKLSACFFAPSKQAKTNLIKEGAKPDKVWVVGNTSIDAMRLIKESPGHKEKVAHASKLIIVTIHRRENQGEILREICTALRYIAMGFLDIRVIFYLHPNPAINHVVQKLLSDVDNIDLVLPTDHISFIRLLSKCLFVITDSGGIQEEVTFIGKPVLVVRNVTERPEGVRAGTAILTGTKAVDIVKHCRRLLESPKLLHGMSRVHFPYGDGHAAQKIVNILEQEYIKGTVW